MSGPAPQTQAVGSAPNPVIHEVTEPWEAREATETDVGWAACGGSQDHIHIALLSGPRSCFPRRFVCVPCTGLRKLTDAAQAPPVFGD